MATADEILRAHLRKNGVMVTKMFSKYLTDAMEEYAALKVKQAVLYTLQNADKPFSGSINDFVNKVSNSINNQ
jgi:hypothetical protein